MLFNYTYITHDMEKMQKYMDYIFYEVWCKAKEFDDFDISLFNGNKELQEIIKAFNFLDKSPEWGKYFLERVKNTFELFKQLSCLHLLRLKYWYKVNNEIEKLCKGKHYPIMYKKLDIFHKELSAEIKKLYSPLYDKKIIGLKDITDKIGKIDKHYKDFMTTNNKEICPFCGINLMKGIHHTKREAYDHFLPKGKYPFNSINFKNLAPMCHECNSSYKLENNPIFDKSDNRRKAFYPYNLEKTNIDIKLSLTSIDIKPKNINLTFTATKQEEVNTWSDLFGIEERYKAVFSGADGKNWLSQIIDEASDFDINITDYLETKKKQYSKKQYHEKNFLRIPFLEACESNGMFNKNHLTNTRDCEIIQLQQSRIL